MRLVTRLFTLLLLIFSGFIGQAQSVLDPSDPIVTYSSSTPPTEPAWGQIGKWVRTKRVSFNTTSYKCYIYKGSPFRLKFPKTYNPTAADGKKYPMMIFFHGLGEAGSKYDNEYQLYHGGDFFRASVDNGSFDGYIICMQSTSYWGNNHYDLLKEIVDYMVANNKLDPFQISVNGLSAGGQASWEMANRYPNMISAMLPMSWTSFFYANDPWLTQLKSMPKWIFQGGRDGSPDPNTTEFVRDGFLNAGGYFKYTLYPDLGHGTWDRAWSEPDFWKFQLRAYPSNPWPLFGRSEFCPADPIDASLVLSPGFDAYEWRRDGVLIAGASSNTYHATVAGTYTARVLEGGRWSDWSKTPVIVKVKDATVTPAITVSGLASRVLPALDGSTSVQLEIPAGFVTYDWQKTDNPTTLSTTRTLNVSTPGDYKVKVTEQFGCSSNFSAPFSVIDANGPNKPDAATNLIATTISKTSIRLDWIDNPSPQFNETNFEVYGGTQQGGPYKLIGIVGQNVRRFTATGLNPNTNYYFRIRAVNNTGAAPASNEASGATQVDTQAPNAPTNLRIVSTSRTTITVQWDGALDDVGVTKYEIYVNGQKSYITTGLNFTISGLKSPNSYNVTVKALDLAGNLSPFSNQVTGEPLLSGLDYKYFIFNNGTPSVLPDFGTLEPAATGTVPNVTLTPATQAENYGFLWEGYINITAAGNYVFRTSSDDGSRLWLGAKNATGSPYNVAAYLKINNDGLHGTTNVSSSSIPLEVGTYPIALAYFQGTGGAVVSLLWDLPTTGTNYVAIPNSAFADNFVTNGTKPAKPSNLVATPVSYKQINLTWTDNSNNEAAFEVWRSTSPTSNFTTVGQVAANTTSFKDSSLNPNTKYYYRIRSINQYGESDFDKVGAGIDYAYYETSSSLSALPNFGSLTAIETGHVNNIGLGMQNRADGFSLRFTGYLNIPVSKVYTFYLSSDDGSKLIIDGNVIINHDGAHAASERSGSKQLSQGLHTIEVQYFEAGGGESLSLQISASGVITKQAVPDSYFGNELTNATTLAPPFAPVAPSNLVATPQSKSTVSVTWTDNATTETRYELFRSAGNNASYILYATLPANTTSFNETGLFPNVVYYYKVRAVGTSISPFSNEDTAKTWNTAPVISQLPASRTARYGVTSTVLITASDSDGDVLSFTAQNLPSFASLVNNGNKTATLTLNPSSAQQGTYSNIRITVNDPNGGSDFTQFNLTVNGNYEPAVSSISNYTVSENDNVAIPLSATDQNAGDVITWSVVNLPNAFTLTPGANGSATLSLKPGYGTAGSYTVLVTASDGNGGYGTRQFNLTVNDKNPNYKVYIRLKGAANIGAPWNNVTTSTSTNFADENGNATTIGLTISDMFSVTSQGPVTGNNSGIFPDAVIQDAFEFGTWWEMPEVRTAVLTGLNPALKYSFTIFASSNRDITPDNGNTNFTVNGQTKSLYVQNNTKNTVTFYNIAPASNGTITITLSKGAGATAGFLNAIVLSTVYDDGSVPVDPSALIAQNVPAQGVQLSWHDNSYNESGFEIHRATNAAGPFTLVGTALGSDATSYMDSTVSGNTQYYYKVRAISASNLTSAFTNVASIVTLNRIPKLNSITDVTLKNNQSLTINISASDDPSDALSITAVNLPQFATLTDNGNGTATIDIIPKISSTGTYNDIVITAKDNKGGSSSTSFDITVLDKDMQSIYLNFTYGAVAGKPWNNLGNWPVAGTTYSGLKDDRDSVWTSVSVNLQSGFAAIGQTGMRSNTGKEIYPLNVVRTGVYDNSTATRTILVSGLSTSRKYNFVFFASHEDGSTGSTNYTIGGVTVTLDAAFNINKTVQINGVTPNASGQVSIGVSKVSGNDNMYLNAMVIQSYIPAVSPFIAPTDLRVVSATRKSISLQWQDRSDNETNFDIYRAVAGGSYQSVGSVLANVTSFVDSSASLLPNTTYYYLVSARKSGGSSGYSNVAVGHTYAYSVYVNVSTSYNSGSPWNNLSAPPQIGYVWDNFKDETNAVTSIGMVETGVWAGVYGAGINTGNNSGVFPDNVMIESYGLFEGQSATLKLTGLNVSMKYDLSFFASSVASGDLTSGYTVNGKTVLLNAALNKKSPVTMYDVVPDEFGEITITIAPGTPTSQFGLIGALIIQGFTPANTSIPNPPARFANGDMQVQQVQTAVTDIPDKVSIVAYPNPFDQYFTLTVSTEEPEKLDVLVYDLQGRLMYQHRFGNLNSGTNTLRIQPDKAFAPGVYFVKAILGNRKDSGLIKVIKK
jgi:pimeloyl-ACP methyl ester carboxylesterase